MDKTASLTKAILSVIEHKGTERPFTGRYEASDEPGTYLCRRCGLALFYSEDKFHSGCGWPSFDKAIPGSVLEKPDLDGQRTEILCRRCLGHLGHVFTGEKMTPLNTRHCVNSISLDHVSQKVEDTEEAIFAAGCFWGVEYYFKRLPGILKTEVGYSGGFLENPTYSDICRGDTGHFEVIRVLYDPKVIDYERVAQFFFEIHDPTHAHGQGPDMGQQYLSVGFYYEKSQKVSLEDLIAILRSKGYQVATQVLPVQVFWPAEQYHQGYYENKGILPYCHRYEKKFD